MSETGSKKNSTMIALAVVLVVAVILSVVLLSQRSSLSAQVDTLTEELAESREAWETTAAEKEAIEAELQQAQSDLREAEMALEESTIKIGQLESDLAEAERVRVEAQTSLNTVYEQIDGVMSTLNYARSVLSGEDVPAETPLPAADDEVPPVAPADDEIPPVTDEAQTDGEPEPEAAEAPEAPTEEPDAEPADETAEEPDAEPADESAEEPAEESENAADEVNALAADPEPVELGTVTDLPDGETAAPEIPEDAMALEVVLEDETTLTLYVKVEEDAITFLYAEELDEAFLEQFIGKVLPVALASDEEPEGIAPIEDDEATTQAVIDAINSLIPAEDEAPEAEAA